MRRLILFIIVFTCLIVFGVQTCFGAEVSGGTFENSWVYFTNVNAGNYNLTVYQDSSNAVKLLDIPSLYIADGVHNYSYTDLDSVYESVDITVYYAGGRLECAITAFDTSSGSNTTIFDTSLYPDMVAVLTPYGAEPTVEPILGVFSSASSWVTSQLGGFTSMFWNPEQGLTYLGVLAVAGLGIFVIFILVSFIRRCIG